MDRAMQAGVVLGRQQLQVFQSVVALVPVDVVDVFPRMKQLAQVALHYRPMFQPDARLDVARSRSQTFVEAFP
jgi:hypothetical protein